MHDNKILKEIGISITPYSNLVYFGYSEEGLILTQDSVGEIRVLFNDRNWTPVFTSDQRGSSKRFWCLGMCEYQLFGVQLPKDVLEPPVFPRPQTTILKMELQTVNENEKRFNDILLKKMILEHEKYRSQYWIKYKIGRENGDLLQRYSSSILF